MKTEETSSPDLSPSSGSLQASHPSHALLPLTLQPVYRFGPGAAAATYNLMQNQPWNSSHNNIHDHKMSYSDDYDDGAELALDNSDGLAAIIGSSSANERTVRRRSSKGTS